MKSIMRDMARSTLLASASLVAIATVPAHAQEAEEDAYAMDTIIVTGVRGSILNSLEQKRDAAGFVDAISAEDLGKFPDLNISESLQRIPGVTLFRNNTGDGQSINLRGLGAEFTRVEINGVTGTSNGTAGRFGGSAFGVSGGFNFEILASELFDNVTVKKSPAASDIEGGLAGLVQLSTPRAFDRDGFNFSVSGQAQISETAEDVGPRLAAVLSQNWNDRFGVTASVAYSDTAFKTDSNGGISLRPLSAPATADLRASATEEQLNALLPQTINYQVDVEDRKTLGVTGGFQFRPSDNIELTVDAIYAEIDSDRFFTRADAPPESQISAVTNDVIEDGVFTSGTFSTVQQRIAANDLSSDEDFFQLSGKVDFDLGGGWTVTPFVGYSKREIERQGQLLSFARGDLATGQQTREDVTYTINGDFIEFSTPGTDYSANSEPSEFFINVFLLRPSDDEDEEFSTKLDFVKEFDDSPLTRFNFGARYSDREISRRSFEVRVDNAAADTDLRTLPSLADALVVNDFDISGAPASFPSTIITADPRRILELYLPNGFDESQFNTPVTGPVGVVDVAGIAIDGAIFRNFQQNTASRTFSGQEETFAAYAEATFEFDDLLVNAGLRYVDTTQTSDGFSLGNGVSSPISIENDYQEFLPSLTARYTVTDDVILRGAYSRTLTRPTLFDLRVSEVFSGIDESGGSGSRGNPLLEPFTSDNIDIGVEWYFAEESLLAVNFFHKNIDGLIVSGTFTDDRTFFSQVTNEEVTAPITFSVPVNGEQTSINGIEVLAQSRFDFLPGVLSNMGGIFNYTYADSDAAFEEGDDSSQINGLPGLSKNSFNAILYYDDGRLDGRLSYAWRDEFVEDLAGSFGQPVFQEAFGQLDLSVNYDLTDSLTLQFQGLNLTNELLKINSLQGAPHTTSQLDRRWFVGARYNF